MIGVSGIGGPEEKDVYNANRIPAYTDRILFSFNKAVCSAKLLQYTAVERQRTSDHIPVVALFRLVPVVPLIRSRCPPPTPHPHQEQGQQYRSHSFPPSPLSSSVLVPDSIYRPLTIPPSGLLLGVTTTTSTGSTTTGATSKTSTGSAATRTGTVSKIDEKKGRAPPDLLLMSRNDHITQDSRDDIIHLRRPPPRPAAVKTTFVSPRD